MENIASKDSFNINSYNSISHLLNLPMSLPMSQLFNVPNTIPKIMLTYQLLINGDIV